MNEKSRRTVVIAYVNARHLDVTSNDQMLEFLRGCKDRLRNVFPKNQVITIPVQEDAFVRVEAMTVEEDDYFSIMQTDSTKKRRMHIECGLTGDTFGAIGYCEDKVVTIEAVLRWEAVADVYSYIDRILRRGYNVEKITTEQFQSMDLRERLKANCNVQTSIISVFNDSEIYESLKSWKKSGQVNGLGLVPQLGVLDREMRNGWAAIAGLAWSFLGGLTRDAE